MSVGPFTIPFVRIQIPGRAMDLPCRHRNVKLVDDCQGTVDTRSGAVEVFFGSGYTRLDLPGQRAHVRTRERKCGCQELIRVTMSIRNIGGLQPSFNHSEVTVQ